jgi:hypothetical protein|tara:strand:- start:566 stop:769 length:204 start_codon:yes stop_codon:yes gene_type:complete
MNKKPMNPGMKALKKKNPKVAEKMGFKKGGKLTKKAGGRVKKMGGGSMMMKKPMANQMYKKGGSAKK